MIRNLTIIAAIAIAALTPQGVNGGGGVHLGGQGLRIDMEPRHPGGQSDGPVGGADCRVRVNQREVVLHWTATSFQHVDYPDFESDTVIAATMTGRVGAVSVSPKKIVDRTNVGRGDDGASVAMGIVGNGQVTIRLDVGIENPMAVAGQHSTTVVLTVTGH